MNGRELTLTERQAICPGFVKNGGMMRETDVNNISFIPDRLVHKRQRESSWWMDFYLERQELRLTLAFL